MAHSLYPALQPSAGFPITPSDTVDIVGDLGNKEEITHVFVHNRSAGGEVRVMPAGQRVPPAITLTGTSGTANISINGTAYLATFDTSLTVTATNFVTAYRAILANLNIRISSSGAELRFFGANPATLAIANVSGDLNGTILAPSPITIYINQGAESPMPVSRVYATSPVPPASLTAEYGGGR